ncbi:MAG: toll/interleukin-1 receptor domain-containing protein [Ktedonobacteraceae bacterium]|nr:toll/interleukin-1 receptor domain-containing protein [Ktedonobacteraceae bacterium]
MDSIKVVCCYAREDQRFLKELNKYLAPLQRVGNITLWADINISPGEVWERELHARLDQAQIILLLVSASFIASDYCYHQEMHRALHRHRHGEARVIPIILAAVMWQITPLGELQALPEDARPVTHWHNSDEAFANVVEGIHQVVSILLQGKTSREGKRSVPPYQLVGCEVELPNGFLCSIPPIGRCTDCGRAFCGSHQSGNLCLPCGDKAAKEAAKWTKLFNFAYHYLYDGAAFADLRDSGVPPTAEIVCSYKQWRGVPLTVRNPTEVVWNWEQLYNSGNQYKEVTSRQKGWFLGKLRWSLSGATASYDTVVLSEPLLVADQETYGSSGGRFSVFHRETINSPIPVEPDRNGAYKTIIDEDYSPDGSYSFRRFLYDDIIEAVRIIRQLIGRRVGPPDIE